MTTIISYNDYLSSKNEGLSFNEIIKKCEKHNYDKIKNTGIKIVNNKTLISLTGLAITTLLQISTNQVINANTVELLIPDPDNLTNTSTLTCFGELFYMCTKIWFLIL